MELEYITEEDEYSISEFYDKFHTDLPQVVQVSHDCQDNEVENKFVTGEVLYIAAVAKQRRVVAKLQTGQNTRTLSIPVTFSDNLCISKHGKCGREQTLKEILKHHWLPLTVQYPPANIIFLEDTAIKTSDLPHLELVKRFVEIHLLGNYLQEGKLGETIIHIPVYLPHVRIRRVSGMKYLTQIGWNKHCDSLKENSRFLHYNLHFGNQQVAEYDQSRLHTHTKYTYTVPALYDNLINIITRWPGCNAGSPSVEQCDENPLQSNANREVYEDLVRDKQGQLSAYEDLSVNDSEQKSIKLIESMSCEEILTRLKRLGLDKYVQLFIYHAIDGELLVSMDENVFMEELVMTREELTRLKGVSKYQKKEQTALDIPSKTCKNKTNAILPETNDLYQIPKLFTKPYTPAPTTSIDKNILMQEPGMTNENLSRLRDVSECKDEEETVPAVPPRTYKTKHDVKLPETNVSNHVPKLYPKPRLQAPKTSTPHPCQDMTKHRPGENNNFSNIKHLDDSGSQYPHAIPNTYTAMPKQSTCSAKTK